MPTSLPGFPLIEGRSPGGPRHYLDGAPVRAGTPLYLLTPLGWMPGRYEWSFDAGTPADFYLSLPGVYRQVRLQIPDGARLAWESE